MKLQVKHFLYCKRGVTAAPEQTHVLHYQGEGDEQLAEKESFIKANSPDN